MKIKLLSILLILSLRTIGLCQYIESKDTNLRILLISDLNDSYGSVTYSNEVKAMIDKIAELKPDLILCAGDMVAGLKTSLSPEHIVDM